MKTYSTFDAAGAPTGFYNDEVHGLLRLLVPDPTFTGNGQAPLIDGGPNPDTKIPLDAVEITDTQYHDMLDNQGLRRVRLVSGVAVVDVVSLPPPTVAQENAPILARLNKIDLNSIRSIREYIASKADAPKFLKDQENEALLERGKLK